jgi:hypothetical protein
MLDVKSAVEHYSEFIERRALARLGPAFGRAHMSDADRGVPGIHPAHIFFH